MPLNDPAPSRQLYAITDVLVWDMDTPQPDDFSEYTGVSFNQMTDPYAPDVIGVRVEGNNVNYLIGPLAVAIYVKYSLIDFANPPVDAKILTDISVTHWPSWVPKTPGGDDCPHDGWEVASGVVGGKQGGLTPQTKGPCWRMGLVVKYQPVQGFPADGSFVTNLCLSRTRNKGPNPPLFAEANGGIWPVKVAGDIDIHRGCGDNWAYYLCAAKGKEAPPFPKDTTIPNAKKVLFMEQFAPYIYMAKNEMFFPSTVEYAFNNMVRFQGDDGNYWITTRHKLDGPDEILPFFKGNLENAKAYAFWVEKDYHIKEITYFVFCPYNLGKDILGTIVGCHVGDWEHITVRLGWAAPKDSTGEWVLEPISVYLSQHSWGDSRSWDEVKKGGANNEAPIVYSAKGSHAMYFEPGSHSYKTFLSDSCSQGQPFDLRGKFVGFDYTSRAYLPDGQPWPEWMNTNFKNPGVDPVGNSIYRWGNSESGWTFGYWILEDGPTGPISKGQVWDPHIFEGNGEDVSSRTDASRPRQCGGCSSQ